VHVRHTIGQITPDAAKARRQYQPFLDLIYTRRGGAPFKVVHLVSGINFLVLSVNLIPVPLSLTCLFMLNCLSTHHSQHP